MALKADVIIDGPIKDVWKKISEIEKSVEFISGIDKIVVLEKPDQGLVGFKWEETRTMFGKSAVETMWITKAVENDFYQTRAERPGIVYISTLRVSDQEGKTHLVMEFEAEFLSFGTRMLGAIMGVFFNGVTRKALQQDLEDIKANVERQ